MRLAFLGTFLSLHEATSHRQDHPELCLAAHHARVRVGRSLERVGFNHRTHAAQFGEAHGVFGISRCSRDVALNGATSTTSNKELEWCDLYWVGRDADNEQPAGDRQPLDQLGDGFRAWGCREDDLCTAQLL